MNAHTSSSCLLAVIAIFMTTTAVMSHIVSPPAKIAGHDSISSIALKKDVVTGSKIPNSSTIAPASPSQHISSAINKNLYDGATHAPINDSNHDNVPVVSETLAKTKWYYLTFLVLNILSCILMLNTLVHELFKSQGHSHFLKNFTTGVALSHFIAFFPGIIGKPTVANVKLTGISKLIIIINTHGWQLVNNIELYTILKTMDNISEFKNEISKCTTFHIFCWFFQFISSVYSVHDIFHQVQHDEPTKLLPNLKILGVYSVLYSVLTELIPGLVNIIVNLYCFKYKEIKISSIHPDLLSFYENRIATRNLMFKLSVLMFTVDCLYILDTTMEWNFNAIHILRLLKSAQGIFIFYVIVFRSLAPVLYNKLLKRLRRPKGRENEETDNPIHTITQLITTV